MYWYEAEVRELEALRMRRPPPPFPAVFYGSSSIRLWATLAEDLGDPRALNLGFGGSTLEACVYFFERLVLPVRPASLTLYAGDNDLGDGRKPEEVIRSFRAFAAKMERYLPEIPFGYISIKISPARFALRERIRAVNEAIAAEIAHHEGGYFVDVTGAMLDAEKLPRRELFSPDGLHMSRAGELLWAELLEPHRQQIFTPICHGVNMGVGLTGLCSGESESRVP